MLPPFNVYVSNFTQAGSDIFLFRGATNRTCCISFGPTELFIIERCLCYKGACKERFDYANTSVYWVPLNWRKLNFESILKAFKHTNVLKHFSVFEKIIGDKITVDIGNASLLTNASLVCQLFKKVILLVGPYVQCRCKGKCKLKCKQQSHIPQMQMQV